MPHHCRTGTPVLEARLSDQSSQRLARGRNRSRLCSGWYQQGRLPGDDGAFMTHDSKGRRSETAPAVCVQCIPVRAAAAKSMFCATGADCALCMTVTKVRLVSPHSQTGPLGSKKRACLSQNTRGRHHSRHDLRNPPCNPQVTGRIRVDSRRAPLARRPCIGWWADQIDRGSASCGGVPSASRSMSGWRSMIYAAACPDSDHACLPSAPSDRSARGRDRAAFSACAWKDVPR